MNCSTLMSSLLRVPQEARSTVFMPAVRVDTDWNSEAIILPGTDSPPSVAGCLLYTSSIIMNQNSSVRKLVHCGVVAAIYVVLCLALQPLSYGAVQVRVACLLYTSWRRCRPDRRSRWRW